MLVMAKMSSLCSESYKKNRKKKKNLVTFDATPFFWKRTWVEGLVLMSPEKRFSWRSVGVELWRFFKNRFGANFLASGVLKKKKKIKKINKKCPRQRETDRYLSEKRAIPCKPPTYHQTVVAAAGNKFRTSVAAPALCSPLLAASCRSTLWCLLKQLAPATQACTFFSTKVLPEAARPRGHGTG